MRGGEREGEREGGSHSVQLETFKREVDVLSMVDHPNVVKLYGACLCPPNNVFICMELMVESLRDRLDRIKREHTSKQEKRKRVKKQEAREAREAREGREGREGREKGVGECQCLSSPFIPQK